MSVLLVSWDGPEHGARAMARDRVLTTLIAPGAGISGLIRFHGWSRPCLSLGRAQRVEAERLDALVSDGIDVVRRPTGGGWLLHLPGDLAVSWVDPGPLGAGGLRGASRRVAEAIAGGFRRVGVPAQVSLVEGGRSRSEICFQRVDREEVVAADAKVAGVALARIGRAALVQAAIPLAPVAPSVAGAEQEWDPCRSSAVAAACGADPFALRKAVGAAIAEQGALESERWFWSPGALADAESADRHAHSGGVARGIGSESVMPS